MLATHVQHPSKTLILEYIMTKLGMPVQLILPAPLKLSGGDFIPVNEDLCFMGVSR